MILITGGASSGKSQFAERLVMELIEENLGQVLYIATSQAFDTEMATKIEKHKQSRPDYWHTNETYHNMGQLIAQKGHDYNVILLECITTMLSNLLFDEVGDLPVEQIDFTELEALLNQQIERLITACQQSQCEIVIVTNELGLGVVPENRLARHFRDIAGNINQRLAQAADEVHFVVSGINMKIKG